MAHAHGKLQLIACSGNKVLADKISSKMGIPETRVLVGTFNDGETRIEIKENVRGGDVFVIQSTCSPVNNNLMELILMIDALKRSSANRITIIVPYFGYARQDRKHSGRVPISAKIVADLIETAGAHRVVCMDLHASQIQGFFRIPVDHLSAGEILFTQYIKMNFELSEVVVVSPDAGGVDRARCVKNRAGVCSMAIVDKCRTAPGEAVAVNLIGDVKGKHAIIVDDMCDTGGSLCECAAILTQNGAATVTACIVHPVLSGPAIERIEESCIVKFITTDTIPHEANKFSKLQVLSTSDIFSETIRRIHNDESVSVLFK
jgi:ribose-phosphate pyrophosphokinase